MQPIQINSEMGLSIKDRKVNIKRYQKKESYGAECDESLPLQEKKLNIQDEEDSQ